MSAEELTHEVQQQVEIANAALKQAAKLIAITGITKLSEVHVNVIFRVLQEVADDWDELASTVEAELHRRRGI